MARHALVNTDNKVVNIIMWEGAEWLPPRNHTVIDVSNIDCHIGDTYDQQNNNFIRKSDSE